MTPATFKRYVEAIMTASIPAVREVAIEPAAPDAPLSPVLDVVLVPRDTRDTRDTADTDRDGSACSSTCGFCGRCTDGVHANCLCADCGSAFWKGPEDSDSYCDGCRDQRDAFTTALELRMAKADLNSVTSSHIPASHIPARKDVA